jgi:hypothetical protein
LTLCPEHSIFISPLLGGEASGSGGFVTTRSAFIFVLSLSLVVGIASIALASDHVVSGSTSHERHQLIPILGQAQCDPTNGDPANPDDINNICRYAIRGNYADTSDEAYLGTGKLNGRFTFHTTSFDGTIGQYGCFHPSGGVVKFTDVAGDRIRFKIERKTSTICQMWDGTTDGPDGVRTGPTRTIHWDLTATVGGCSGSFCGDTGSLSWDSTATFDETNPGLFQYLDTATFSGIVTSP